MISNFIPELSFSTEMSAFQSHTIKILLENRLCANMVMTHALKILQFTDFMLSFSHLIFANILFLFFVIFLLDSLVDNDECTLNATHIKI